jgi:hypothetical protein
MTVIIWSVFVILGIELCVFFLFGGAAIILKAFAPSFYKRHIAVDTTSYLPQQCFICNSASCKNCQIFAVSELPGELIAFSSAPKNAINLAKQTTLSIPGKVVPDVSFRRVISGNISIKSQIQDMQLEAHR